MIKPDLIIRSYRKTLCLSISKNGELIVRAPKKLDMKYIIDFIKEKEKWIIKKQKDVREKNNKNINIISYNTFLYFGKQLKRQELQGVKKIEVVDNQILFPADLDGREIISWARKFYIETTKEVLLTRVKYFAELMKLSYSSVSIMNNKTRWGSCTLTGDLKFNFRISMLPHKTIDYIIIHELAHLIEFNHSKKFHKIVESVMPKWKLEREELKKYDYVLGLFR